MYMPLFQPAFESFAGGRGGDFFKGWAECCPALTVQHSSTFLASSYGTCDLVASDLSPPKQAASQAVKELPGVSTMAVLGPIVALLAIGSNRVRH